jgi:hypothetical protein
VALLGVAASILIGAYFLARGPQPAPPAQVAARHAADSLTRVRLEAFERADYAAWSVALRPDGILVGADPGGVAIGPTAAADAMRAAGPVARDLEPGPVMTGATRRGRLAWAATPLDFRGGGDSLPASGMHSVAWLLQDGEWRVMVEHDARTPDWEALRAAAAARPFPSPAPLPGVQGRQARDLARRFERWLPDLFGRRVDGEAIGVGPVPGAIAVGDSAVKAMFADLATRLGRPRLLPNGLGAWAPRGRGVGWVAANLEVTPPEWGGTTLPLRFTGVYRERDEDNWSLVLAHLSVGVPDVPEPVAARAAR